MRDIYQVLRRKELDLARLAAEVEALRIAAPLLSDAAEAGDDNQPTSTRSNAPWQSVRFPQAVNESPQPADAPKWTDRGKRWP